MKWFRRKSKLEKFYDKNKRLINYSIASIVCTLLLYLIYFTITWLSNGYYLIANVVAYLVSFTLLYIWDQQIFKARPRKRKERIKQLHRFIIFRIIGLIIDSSILLMFIEVFLMPNVVAKISSSLMVFAYNYYVNKLFVFTDKNSAL